MSAFSHVSVMQQMPIIFKHSTAASSSILYRTIRTFASNTPGRDDASGMVPSLRDVLEPWGSQSLASTECWGKNSMAFSLRGAVSFVCSNWLMIGGEWQFSRWSVTVGVFCWCLCLLCSRIKKADSASAFVRCGFMNTYAFTSAFVELLSCFADLISCWAVLASSNSRFLIVISCAWSSHNSIVFTISIFSDSNTW